MATDRNWFSGPPPAVGWYNASVQRNLNVWRWWDGSFWSYAAFDTDTAERAAKAATCRSASQNLEWSDYWPTGDRLG